MHTIYLNQDLIIRLVCTVMLNDDEDADIDKYEDDGDGGNDYHA